MKCDVLAIFTMALVSPALAADMPAYHLMDNSPLDFVAPTVNSTSNLTEAALGTIVYDATAGAFYGLAPSSGTSPGHWLQLGASTVSGNPNVTSNSTGNEHIERLSITSTCTTSPCTIARQSGSWATSVNRSATGQYVVNIATGEFSAPPTCTCTINPTSTNYVVCEIGSPSVNTSTAVYVQIGQSGTGTDDDAFDLICMGPH